MVMGRGVEWDGARSREKRVSKRRSKTSLTPGIFILYIYIYIFLDLGGAESRITWRDPENLFSPFLTQRLSPPPPKPRSTSSFTPMSLPGLLPHYHSQNSR